jgi:hypothetical protein
LIQKEKKRERESKKEGTEMNENHLTMKLSNIWDVVLEARGMWMKSNKSQTQNEFFFICLSDWIALKGETLETIKPYL